MIRTLDWPVDAVILVESTWFRHFEQSAFFGKFSEMIVGIVLRDLLGSRVRRQVPLSDIRGYADFGVDGLGLVEVTTAKEPDPDTEV